MVAPKLRFKEFDGDWSASNLEQTTQYFKGFAFKSESYKEDGIRIIRVSDLDKDSIKYQNEAIFLDKIEAQNYLNWEVKKKDIIVTTVGSKPHLIDSAVGRPIFVKNDSEGLLNQNLLVLRPKNENIDAYFIFSQLLDKKYLTHIETIQRGNANQSNITVKDLQEFEVFQTSKEEQTKIASFLSAVDEKISQLTKKNQLLSQYKQGMMQKLFSQQLRFKADDGREFGEWENSYIGNECKITTGNKDTQNKVDDGLYPFFVRSQTVEKINSYSMDCEAILTSGDGVGVGKNYHYINGKFDFHQRVYCLYEFSERLIGRYLYIYFSNYFYDRVKRLSAKNSVDSVRMDMISKMEIKLPCLEEQTKIANFLSAIDQKIEVVAKQIEQAKTWKKGLLQQMFV